MSQKIKAFLTSALTDNIIDEYADGNSNQLYKRKQAAAESS